MIPNIALIVFVKIRGKPIRPKKLIAYDNKDREIQIAIDKKILFVNFPCTIIFSSISNSFLKQKSAPTEVSAPKNANPNCRQTISS